MAQNCTTEVTAITTVYSQNLHRPFLRAVCMVSLMKVQVYVWIGTGLCGLWHGACVNPKEWCKCRYGS